MPRIPRYIGQKLRGQRRHTQTPSPSCGLPRLREVMKEGGDIGITGIQVVPQAARLVFCEITGDECGLSRSRGTGNPDQWVVLTALCHEGEETRTTRDLMEAWTCQLRER